MCIIDIAKSFSSYSDSQSARLEISALNLLCPLDCSLLLVFYKLLNLLRVEICQLLFTTIQLFNAFLLLSHKFASLLLDDFTLIAQHLQLLFLCGALLFVFLMRCAHCTKHLLVNLTELSADFVFLEALEYIFKVFFVN